VSAALVLVDSLPWERSLRSLSAWLGISERELGVKVLEEGALPGGRVVAWKSGAVSLPTWRPGLCWREDVSVKFGGEGEGERERGG